MVAKVNKFSNKQDCLRHVYDREHKDDVRFELTGEFYEKFDLEVKLHMHNTSKETRNVIVRMYAIAEYYIGLTGEEVDSLHQKVELAGGSGDYHFGCLFCTIISVNVT